MFALFEVDEEEQQVEERSRKWPAEQGSRSGT